MKIKEWVRRDLADFTPYHVEFEDFALKLDANESPFTLSEKVKDDFIKWIQNEEDLNIYPDSDCNKLRECISNFWNIDKCNIMCGVGSDQIIDYITKVFIEPGDAVVVPMPTFAMYSIASVLNHGRVIETDLNGDIAETARSGKAKLVFLCTPNNPTGGSMTEDHIKNILESVECPVVVDEAYADFSGRTMIPYINKYENLIVLRTFSKAYGLAGARVGYAAACEEMIETLNIVKAPYNLSSISQFLAVSALEDSEEYKRRIATLKYNKDKLYNELVKISGLTVLQSDANFLYIKSDRDLAGELKKHGILVRKFGNGDIRLSIGTEHQNNIVLDIIRAYFRN